MTNNIFIRDKGLPHIREIINIEELTELFQSYSDITGMVTALLDLDGNILIATNWQDSCTQFHRVGEITRQRCLESDTALAGSLAKGDKYNVYRCRNGLVDVATPVFIEGQHMANFFTGQFFFKKPDLDYFSRQADEVGFDKNGYLNAINKVPVYDEATIKSHMAFLVRIAEMVGKMGAANLRVLQANTELERHKAHLQSLVEERTAKLKISLEAAETANLAKSKFLTNMSHELRTPLNAVLGYSQILGARESDPTKKQYLQSINLAGKGLLDLINAVLDLSKIETGKMPVQTNPMSLRTLANEIGMIFGRQAAEKDLEFIIEISPNVPAAINFDEVKLRQILINLTGNAIKFTDTGHIQILVYSNSNASSTTSADITIAIKDSGKGISKADQERIFNAFEQAKNQKISEYGGTGLGLALCKQLTTLLGGELMVESAADKGSVFTCQFNNVEVLPADSFVDVTETKNLYGTTHFSPATILVVDDNAINRDLLITYLSEWNFRTFEASDGKQAIEQAKHHQPDLIFMDMKMPVMDGYEATQRLKNDAETQHIPIVAATASALSQDEKLIREVTDDYLRKPIIYSELVKCLSRFLLKESPIEAPARIKRVLIVDDDSMNRVILSNILQEWENLEISIACSGHEAVDLSCRADRPDIILMDCEMPGMNGIEATLKIRAWEAENNVNNVRILAVTAYTADELKSKGYSDEWHLLKPIRPLRMPIFKNFLAQLGSWFSHLRIRFGSSFYTAGLYSTWSVANTYLTNNLPERRPH